jgi:hypothetical protein
MAARIYCKEIEGVTLKLREALQGINSQTIRIRLMLYQKPNLQEEKELLEVMERLRIEINDIWSQVEEIPEMR